MMVLCEPGHVGAAFIILTILIIYGFYNLRELLGQSSASHHDNFHLPQLTYEYTLHYFRKSFGTEITSSAGFIDKPRI